MRVTSRFFSAALLLIAAVAAARAQGTGAAPRPPAPDVAKPGAELPPTAPAVASTSAVDTTANMPAAEAAPAPPAPKAVAVTSRNEQTKPQLRIGVGGWFYAGVVVAALVGIATLSGRRRTHKRISIVGLASSSTELKPSHAPHR